MTDRWTGTSCIWCDQVVPDNTPRVGCCIACSRLAEIMFPGKRVPTPMVWEMATYKDLLAKVRALNLKRIHSGGA